MYEVLYQGVDTLDIAFQGAFPDATLKELDTAAEEARTANKEQLLAIGPGAVQVLVQPNGMRGGFRYVFNTGPTGAIFAVKDNTDLKEWNLFISIRALCLLTLGYQGAKERLHNTLADMGFLVTDLSVNRIDYAVDVLAPDFTLDVQNFVMPGQAKARPYWSKERELDDDGYRPKAVIRGRKFESVTIGTMPNRQVIVYNKRRAAIDQHQPYWFEAWGIEKDDPGAQVWRVEIRGGRDAWAKRLLKRSYEAIESDLKPFLLGATAEIRYVSDKSQQKNVSRLSPHFLWNTVVSAISTNRTAGEPPLPERRALQIIREQRIDHALKQGIGNLFGYFILKGESPDAIAYNMASHMVHAASAYMRIFGREGTAMRIRRSQSKFAFLVEESSQQDH